MTNEKKIDPKKPPAHEVIAALLTQLARDWRLARRCEKAISELDPEQGSSVIGAKAGVLVLVLARMYLPESERPKVATALRRLPKNFVPPMNLDLYAEIEGTTKRGAA